MNEERNPVLKSFQELGCSSHFKISIAYHVYIDLKEVRKLNVQSKYNKDLDIIYFIASGKEFEDESEIFIPLSSASFLSMSWIETIQNAVCQEKEIPRVTLAFREQDSSIMYYSMTKGIIPSAFPHSAEKTIDDSCPIVIDNCDSLEL